jgi:hypothetical protein
VLGALDYLRAAVEKDPFLVVALPRRARGRQPRAWKREVVRRLRQRGVPRERIDELFRLIGAALPPDAVRARAAP